MPGRCRTPASVAACRSAVTSGTTALVHWPCCLSLRWRQVRLDAGKLLACLLHSTKILRATIVLGRMGSNASCTGFVASAFEQSWCVGDVQTGRQYQQDALQQLQNLQRLGRLNPAELQQDEDLALIDLTTLTAGQRS